jgi:hypothetical protein
LKIGIGAGTVLSVVKPLHLPLWANPKPDGLYYELENDEPRSEGPDEAGTDAQQLHADDLGRDPPQGDSGTHPDGKCL